MKICKCICHQEGVDILHCSPCCNYTYQKYIDKDGKIDINKYNKLINENSNNGANCSPNISNY